MRWRLRGAWLWPSFIVLTLAEGVALQVLPIAGDGPAACSRRAAGGLREPDPDRRRGAAGRAPAAAPPPRPPARRGADYAGTALLLVFAAVVLAGGLIHRPAVVAAQEDLRAQSAAVHDFVISQEPKYAPGIALADPMRIQDDLYRTCVPGPDPKRWLCLYVDTKQRRRA
jgi:hypothetical protein